MGAGTQQEQNNEKVSRGGRGKSGFRFFCPWCYPQRSDHNDPVATNGETASNEKTAVNFILGNQSEKSPLLPREGSQSRAGSLDGDSTKSVKNFLSREGLPNYQKKQQSKSRASFPDPSQSRAGSPVSY